MLDAVDACAEASRDPSSHAYEGSPVPPHEEVCYLGDRGLPLRKTRPPTEAEIPIGEHPPASALRLHRPSPIASDKINESFRLSPDSGRQVWVALDCGRFKCCFSIRLHRIGGLPQRCRWSDPLGQRCGTPRASRDTSTRVVHQAGCDSAHHERCRSSLLHRKNQGGR